MSGFVTLAIYTLDGMRVAMLVDRDLTAGQHVALWHGRDAEGAPVATGLYVYRIRTPGFDQTRRMMLVR